MSRPAFAPSPLSAAGSCANCALIGRPSKNSSCGSPPKMEKRGSRWDLAKRKPGVVCMLATLSLVRREFGAYFLSPVAYVVLAVFLAVTGHLFYLTMTQLTAPGPQGIEFPMQLMLGDEKFWLVF